MSNNSYNSTRSIRILASVPFSLGILSVLLLAGLYLRVHNLAGWFNYFSDYDEGAYALAAKFIAEGRMPYKDFPLVQPPLYELVLAGIFKLFHYDLMLARYVSVAASLLNIVLMFAVARRSLGLIPAVIAGAIFAFDPILLYQGRRSVQEPLGLVFVLVGLLLFIYYLDKRQKRWLVGVGVAFGLSLGIKLTFLPLVAGVLVAIALLESGLSWSWLARFGTTRVLLEYLAVGGFIFAMLIFLNSIGVNVPIPVIDPMLGTRGALAGFLLLIGPLIVVVGNNMGSPVWNTLIAAVLKIIRSPSAWLLGIITVLTFGVLIAPFLLIAPQSVIEQVVISQMSRPSGEVPSYLGILRLALYSPEMMKFYALPVLALVPVLYLLLRSRNPTTMHFIIFVGSVLVLGALQMVFHLPRYYVSAYPLLALGIGALFASPFVEFRAHQLIGVGAFIILISSLSIRVMNSNGGYDSMSSFPASERGPYDKVARVISIVKPHAKVYSTSPMLLALTPDLQSVSSYDTFSRLWLAKEKVPNVVESLINEGVDFVVLDPWVKFWGLPLRAQTEELQAEVRKRGQLVSEIGANEFERFEIYYMRRKGSPIFNGNFGYWLSEDPAPVGWNLAINATHNNGVSMKSATLEEQKGVDLEVHQTTDASPGDFTYVKVGQGFVLPSVAIQIRVHPTFRYSQKGGWPFTTAGVEVADGQNHLIWYTFDDRIAPQSFDLPNGHHIEVLNAPLNQWSTQTINIRQTYQKLGWALPSRITLNLFLAAHASQPGDYSAFFGPIQLVDGSLTPTVNGVQTSRN